MTRLRRYRYLGSLFGFINYPYTASIDCFRMQFSFRNRRYCFCSIQFAYPIDRFLTCSSRF
ncbi:hypothetical protein EVA_06815 [gut metagenome]|uniref:Uncharacterized protein n=1 Tax=gut metagenome TaxID=749906 RepID=J9GCM6_9ZZZZ